jgi:formate hydrogenlyase subunit 6/NADH:ubiquinone oxidoreductase subunit I
MKKILKQIPMESKIAILVAVLIVILAQVFTKEYTLQYLEDGELQTESFRSRKEFNKRAFELKADSIKYWIDLNN